MQLTVKSTTRESKQAQGKTYWGIKHEDDNWYNLITDAKPAMGAKYNVDVKETQYNGKTYRWANIIAPQGAAKAQAESNGHVKWEDYRLMAEIAHDLAKVLEPDEQIQIVNGGPEVQHVDRSAARAAIVNTCMIAFANGKISLPQDDEGAPPLDDDIPF